VHVSSRRLEDERLRLVLDPETGGIAELVDKRRALDLAAGPLGLVTVAEDASDTWSHGLARYDAPSGVFRATSVKILERGPLRAGLRVRSAFGASRLTTDILLGLDLGRVELRLRLDWRERRMVAKLRLPLALDRPRFVVETAYAEAERPTDGTEQPGQRWADVSGRGADGRPAGLLVVNDAKYAYDCAGADLGLTIARSPFFAHHDPYVPDDPDAYRVLDQGVQELRLRLHPHDGDRHALAPARRGAELLSPPIPTVESFHAGPFAQAGSLFEIGPANVVLGALKQAEDEPAALVLRVAETAGRPTEAAIQLLDRAFGLRLRPWEVASVAVPDDPAAPVRRVDLLEDPL
jgi:alpha-mannosidase